MLNAFSQYPLLTIAAAIALIITLAAVYAVAVEPYTLTFPRYRLQPERWPRGSPITIAAIADLHIGHPWMTAKRVQHIVDATLEKKPDLIVLLGDYVATNHYVGVWPIEKEAWTTELARLEAPLGVYAILGNHDWWDDDDAQQKRCGPTSVGRALEAVGIPVLENSAVKVTAADQAFWLAGLGDQCAFKIDNGESGNGRPDKYEGVHDLAKTLADVTDDAPIIMLAHEPDIFADMPPRVSVTLSGHTHGGQVQLFGYAPVIPSRYGQRYAYGHIRERDRDLIVSAGLGCSLAPIRFGRPPEVVLIEIS